MNETDTGAIRQIVGVCCF